MLKSELVKLLQDFKASPQSPSHSVIKKENEERISLLENFLKATEASEVTYSDFTEWLQSQGKNSEELFGKQFLRSTNGSGIHMLFIAFWTGGVYLPTLRRFSSAIGAKTARKAQAALLSDNQTSFPLLKFLQYQTKKLSEVGRLVRKKEIERKKTTNSLIWDKIVDELDAARQLLEFEQKTRLNEYLDSDGALKLGALSKTFNQIQMDPSYWRKRLIAAGCEAKFIDPIMQEGVVKDLAALYQRVMHLPAPYDVYIRKEPDTKSVSAYKGKEWRLCCLSGEPQAIQWAYERLKKEDARGWINDAVALTALSGNVVGIRLAIKLTEELRKHLKEYDKKSKMAREQQQLEVLRKFNLASPETSVEEKEIEPNQQELQEKNFKDTQGRTAMAMAVISGQAAAVHFCQEEWQLDPRSNRSLGKLLMRNALTGSGLRMLNFLIEKYFLGLDSVASDVLNPKPPLAIDEKVKGLSAIYLALQYNTAGTVRHLLCLAKPDKPGLSEEKKWGLSALNQAVSLNPALRSALDLNALFYAFEGRNPDNIRLVMKELGFEVRDLLALGVNPLRKAIRSADLHYIKFVVEECGVSVASLVQMDKNEATRQGLKDAKWLKASASVLEECYNIALFADKMDILVYVASRIPYPDLAKQIKVIDAIEDNSMRHKNLQMILSDILHESKINWGQVETVVDEMLDAVDQDLDSLPESSKTQILSQEPASPLSFSSSTSGLNIHEDPENPDQPLENQDDALFELVSPRVVCPEQVSAFRKNRWW